MFGILTLLNCTAGIATDIGPQQTTSKQVHVLLSYLSSFLLYLGQCARRRSKCLRTFIKFHHCGLYNFMKIFHCKKKYEVHGLELDYFPQTQQKCKSGKTQFSSINNARNYISICKRRNLNSTVPFYNG